MCNLSGVKRGYTVVSLYSEQERSTSAMVATVIYDVVQQRSICEKMNYAQIT